MSDLSNQELEETLCLGMESGTIIAKLNKGKVIFKHIAYKRNDETYLTIRQVAEHDHWRWWFARQ